MTIEELYKQSVRNGTEQNLLAETNEISFGYNDGVFKIIYNTAVQWHRFKEEIPDDMERVIVYEPSWGIYIGRFDGLTTTQMAIINIDYYGEHYIEKGKGYWMRLPKPPNEE